MTRQWRYRQSLRMRGHYCRVHEWVYEAVYRLGGRVARSDKKVFISPVNSIYFIDAARTNTSNECLRSEFRIGYIHKKYPYKSMSDKVWQNKTNRIHVDITRGQRLDGEWKYFLILVDRNGDAENLDGFDEIYKMIQLTWKLHLLEINNEQN
jgi:hypothetical protein